MKPSSLSILIGFTGLKVQRKQAQKGMNRNRPGDEISEANILHEAQGVLMKVRRTPYYQYYSARQQPERSGAHEADEGGRITHLELKQNL